MVQTVIAPGSEQARMENPENLKTETANIKSEQKSRSVCHTNLNYEVKSRPFSFLRWSKSLNWVQDSSYSFTMDTLYLQTQRSI